MIVEVRSPFKSPTLGEIPSNVNGKPCIVDLPDAEARSAINCYKAKLTRGEKVNFTPEVDKPKAK